MISGNNFEFATATRILFGPGRLKELETIVSDLGRRCFLVRGSRPEPSSRVVDLLVKSAVEVSSFAFSGEPDVQIIEEGFSLARQHQAEFVIGLGGGSILDAGKAISILLTNDGSIYDYLEVIGEGKPFRNRAVPYIAIPTTAGTGTEVTRNAVVGSLENNVKVSLRSPFMLPRVALVDPQLTFGLPPAITASSGLDALTQLIEPFTSNAVNPLTDAICVEGIRHVAGSLLKAYEDDDPEARTGMSIAALFGGLALANARLGAVHGFAGVLGGLLKAPHGAICARLLPFVMRMNIRKLEENDLEMKLNRYDQIAQILVGHPEARATDGVIWIENLCKEMKIPGLGSFGLSEDHFEEVIEKSAKASSMKGNPVALSTKDKLEVLTAAL